MSALQTALADPSVRARFAEVGTQLFPEGERTVTIDVSDLAPIVVVPPSPARPCASMPWPSMPD